MVNFVTIKVSISDQKKMMNECRKLFLQAHPQFRGMKLSQSFMFNKLVNFYQEAR